MANKEISFIKIYRHTGSLLIKGLMILVIFVNQQQNWDADLHHSEVIERQVNLNKTVAVT
jgi:hypothetical protein